MSETWKRAAEEFLWGADILQTMGRYAQALLLACHAWDLCVKYKRRDLTNEPLKSVPKECVDLIFPQDEKTPEDLVDMEKSLRVINGVKECLGL